MTIRVVDSKPRPKTWKGANGIVYHDLSGFGHLSLDLVSILHQEHIRVAGAGAHTILLLAQDVLTVDFEVQIFASNPQVQASVGSLAIVGSSFMLRHLTSMFLSYHRPYYPVERFDCREDAEAWLLQQQQSGS